MIHQGATYDPSFTLSVNKTAYYWTDFSGRCDIVLEDGTAIELSTDNDGMSLGDDGSIALLYSDTNTAELGKQKGTFVMSATGPDPDGKTRMLMRGKVVVD